MEFNPFTLQGKRILVTGASSGIGREIAISCARMGATIILTGRNTARLEECLAQLASGSHRVTAADLTREEDRSKLVESLPTLDGVVHCAGVGSRVLCKNIDDQDIRYVFQPNMEAPILLQGALLRCMKLKKGSSVVFIASRAAEAPSIGNAVYSASKGAILSYAKCLALELAPRLIRVNCICPAMVWTDLILAGGMDKEQLEESQLRYPLKRYGKPEDVAYLVLYLLSDAAAWMTGSAIDISGGGEGVLTM